MATPLYNANARNAYDTFIPYTKKPRTKTSNVTVSASVGTVTATGAGGYQEEWIPEHHLRKSKSSMSRDNSQLRRDMLISLEEGQNLQGEGGEAYVARPSSYLGGIRNMAGAILGPGTGMKEELQRTKVELQQLDYEFLRAKGDNTTLQRTCFELDTENRRQKHTIQSLQRELTS